jgi:hypothetical protein
MPPVLPETMNVTVTPAVLKTQPDQKLVFTNNHHQFPEFEIKFLGASPASPGDILIGSNQVIINVAPTAIGTFPYVIIYTPKEGDGYPVAAGGFSIRSCSGGCP